MGSLKDRFFRKSFVIELEDEYCYPGDKNFKMADALVMQAAIENYCISSHETIEYLSKEKPITFILNGKHKYTAKLVLGRGRFNQGYYIACTEII